MAVQGGVSVAAEADSAFGSCTFSDKEDAFARKQKE
jgi:hypothetical protein